MYEKDHGWTTVRSRRWKKIDKESRTRKALAWTGCTTFFVSNLPEGTTAETLREKYGTFGPMADAYVSKRKDKGGSFFGFIRFRRVEDINKMLMELNSVVFDGARPLVALPRFDRDGNEIVYYKRSELYTKPHSQDQQIRNFRPVSSGVSFRDMVGGAKVEKPTVSINLDDGKDVTRIDCRSKSSLIGYAKDLAQLNELHNSLNLLNVAGWELKYLGGLRVIISFSSTDDARSVLDNNKMWELWFFSLQWWDEEPVQFERVAWVKIIGIPPPLWNANTCNMVASRFGELLYQSKISGKDDNLAYDCVAILIKNGSMVNERCVISWRGKCYDVWIQEVRHEWLPDCCLSSNDPTEASNSRQKVTEALVTEVFREVADGNGGAFPEEHERSVHENNTHGEEGCMNRHGLSENFKTGVFQFSSDKATNTSSGGIGKTKKGAQPFRCHKPTMLSFGTIGGPDARPRKRRRPEEFDLNISMDSEDDNIQSGDAVGINSEKSDNTLREGTTQNESVDVVQDSLVEIPDSPRVDRERSIPNEVSGTNHIVRVGDPQVPNEPDVGVPESNQEYRESQRLERNRRIQKEMSYTCEIASLIGINLQNNLEELEQVIRGDGVY